MQDFITVILIGEPLMLSLTFTLKTIETTFLEEGEAGE